MATVPRRGSVTRPSLWQAFVSNPAMISLVSLLGIAVTFGGGGSPAPIAELVVQLSAIFTVVFTTLFRGQGQVTSPARSGFTREKIMWLLVLAWVALFLLQLVPLPASVWQGMGGRSQIHEALSIVGEPSGSWPISVSPRSTLTSLLSLIPPLAVLYLASKLSRREREMAMIIVVGLGLLAAIVGAIQLSSGDMHSLRFYEKTHYGVITGFQANRNAAADVFLVALIALFGLHLSALSRRRGRIGERGGAMALGRLLALMILSVAILLTASRMGTGLLGLTLAGMIVWMLFQIEWNRRAIITLAVIAVVIAIGAAVLASNNVLARGIWSRLANTESERTLTWQDSLYVTKLVWPWGSGMGSFRPIFIANEQLEAVDLTSPNRAHNDYLEVLMELGLPGAILLVATASFLIACAFWPSRQGAPSIDPGQRVFAIGTLSIIALHSIVDYPIRSMSIACLTALAGAYICSFALHNSSAEDKLRS